MILRYFTNCKTKDEIRARYRELARKFHPDVNKSPDATQVMQAINAEYTVVFERAYDDAIRARASYPGGWDDHINSAWRAWGAAAHEANKKAHEERERQEKAEREAKRKRDLETEERLRAKIEQVAYMEDCKIEQIGDWLWIFGARVYYRDQLLEIGFKWSQRLKGWYFIANEEELNRRDRYNDHTRGWSLDEMRNRFGSQDVPTRKKSRIEDAE